MFPLEHYTMGPARKLRTKMRKNADRIPPPRLEASLFACFLMSQWAFFMHRKSFQLSKATRVNTITPTTLEFCKERTLSPVLMAQMPHKILLPSAVHLEERLAVSQSVSESGKHSGRQSVGQAGRQTETHSLGFFSGTLGYKQRGEQQLFEQAMVEW